MSEELHEGLTKDEIFQLRTLLSLQKGALGKLADKSDDIIDLVESKRAAQRLYTFVGSFAKWAGGIIGLIVAYKALILGQGSVKP